MSFEDWQKENTSMGIVGGANSVGFDAWKQENQRLGVKPSGFEVWQQENRQLGIKPKQGFVKSFIEHPEKFLPFYGHMIKGERMMSTASAAKRLEADDYSKLTPEKIGWGIAESPQKYSVARQAGAWAMSPYLAGTEAYEKMQWTPERQREHDIDLVSDWLAEASKQYSTGGTIGRILGDMPAFVLEFISTGGLATGAKAATKQVIERAIGKGAKREILAKIGGWAVGSTVQATLGMTPMTFENFAARRLPKDIYTDDAGGLKFEWPTESPYKSFAKAYGDTVIEIASEQSGPAISAVGGKLLNKLPFGKKVVEKLYQAYNKIHPNVSFGNFITKISTKAGYHGTLEELGEEYVGDVMRAIVGVDDFGKGPDAGIGERLVGALNQDIKNTPAMLAAFAVPGVGYKAAGIVAAPPSVKRLENAAKKIQADEKLTDFQKAAALKKLKKLMPIEERLKRAGIELGAEKPAEAKQPWEMTREEFSVTEISLNKDEKRFPQITHVRELLENNGIAIEEIGVTASQAAGVATEKSDVDIYVKVSDADYQKTDDLVEPLSKEGIDVLTNWRGVGKKGGVLRGTKTHQRLIKQAVEQGKPVPSHVLEEYKSEPWAQEALAKMEKPAETKVPGIVRQEQKPGSPFEISESAKRQMGIAQKFENVVTELETKRPELRKQTEEAREKELKEFNEIYKSLEEDDPIIAARIARDQVKGFLRQEIPELKEQISREEVVDLQQAVREANISADKKLSLTHFFEDILAGRQPFRSHIKVFDNFFGTEILKKAPKVKAKGIKRAVDIAIDILNVPKAIRCAMDFSAGGIQALMVLPSHPIIWSKGVGKGYRAFFSQDYLDLMDLEMKTHPLYHLIEEHGRGLITEIGNVKYGEEFFASELAHRIPLIGEGVMASDRAFVGTLNNIRSNLFYQWMEMNPGASNAQIKQMLDHIGNITGRGRGKAGGKFEKYAPELGMALWAPRLILGTVKSMTDFITKPHIRKQAAGDLVRAAGFLTGILALVSLDPDTEVELDPRSSDFGKIKYGNTRLSFFGRHTQIIRFVVQMAMGQKKSTGTGRIHSRPRLEMAARYLRSKTSPIAGATWDVLTGKTFLGERMEYRNPDFMSKYITEQVAPMFLLDVADAIRYQGLGTALWTSPLGLHGIGIQTYEIRRAAESQRLKDHYAHMYYGVDWDQLGPDAQEAMRDHQPLIGIYEDRARAEREQYVYEDWTQAEQRLAGQKVLKKLKKSVRSELERLEMPFGGLSRRLSSDWMLNDKRYKEYQNKTTRIINEVVPKFVESAVWHQMDVTTQRDMLKQMIKQCKDAARQQIINKAKFEDVQRIVGAM